MDHRQFILSNQKTESISALRFKRVIVFYYRRLHCPRNAIHLNLFLAFILRATMNIIKENLFVQGLGFPVDVAYDENGTMYFTDGPVSRYSNNLRIPPYKVSYLREIMILNTRGIWKVLSVAS